MMMTRSLLRSPVGALPLLLSLLVLGCAQFLGFPAYYDPTTYKNLTDVKPEVAALYDTFANDPVDSGRVAAVRLTLARIYEYEKGKGEKNTETTRQIEIIKDMFERHVEDRLKTGKWSATHLANNKDNIAEAFDAAIQTERLKNKNE